MNDYRREAINSSRAAARACTRARRGTSTLSQGRPQGRAPTIYELVHLFNIFVLSMREHLRFLVFTLRFAQPTNIVEDDAHSCIVGTGACPCPVCPCSFLLLCSSYSHYKHQRMLLQILVEFTDNCSMARNATHQWRVKA